MAGSGTFTLKCLSINTRTQSAGQWVKFTGAGWNTATNQDIVNILNEAAGTDFVVLTESLAIPPAGTSAGGTGSLRLNMDDTNIVLVGASGGTYKYNTLPNGFLITSATLNITGCAADLPPTTANSTTLFRKGATVLQTVSPSNYTTFAIPFPSNFSTLTAFSVIEDSYGFDVVTVAGLVAPGAVPATFQGPLSVTGTYTILAFNGTIANPVNVSAGDKVTINGGPLGTIAKILIQYTDSGGTFHSIQVLAQDFVTQNQAQIVFYMPQFGNPPNGTTVNVFVVDNGTQFSGSVPVGTLTVIFADASGLYVLTANKATDTVYAPARDGTTKETNILDPFVDTAFIP